MPEIDAGLVVTTQTTETPMRGLPWKTASKSSCKLAKRSEWLLVTSLGALDCEVVALWSKMRELERKVRTSQGAKAITQEVIYSSRVVPWAARHCRVVGSAYH